MSFTPSPAIAEWAKAHNIEIRNIGRPEWAPLRFICPECKCEIFYSSTTTEGSDIRCDGEKLILGKPCITDGEHHMACECEDPPWDEPDYGDYDETIPLEHYY